MLRRSLLVASLGRYAAAAVSFLTLAVTARILTPADFGVVAMGLSVVAVFEALREFGTSTYIIQAPDLTHRDIRTAFTVMMLTTASLVGMAWLAAAPIALYVRAPGLVGYLHVALPGLLIGPFLATAIALMRRNLMFGTVVRIEASAAVAQGLTAIAMASLGFGAASFAFAGVVYCIVAALLACHATGDLSIFRPCLDNWRNSARFAAYDGVTTVLNRVWDMAPPFVFGRVIGIDAVGIYGRASAICQWPEKILFAGLGAVLLPAFASGERAGHDRKAAYLSALSYITVLQWPALVMLIVLAEPAVRLLLGSQWLSAVPVVRILAGAMLSWFPAYLTYPALVSTGSIGDTTRASLISLPVSLAILILAAPHGLVAVALSMFLIMPGQVLVSLHFVKRRIGFTWGEWFATLRRSLAVAVASAGCALLAIGPLGFSANGSLPGTLAILALGGLGWGVGVVIADHPVRHELRRVGAYLWARFAPERVAAGE